MNYYRFSDNVSWSLEFTTENNEADFTEKLVAALEKCRGRWVSLHERDNLDSLGGHPRPWLDAGGYRAAVFFDGREKPHRLSIPGTYSVRGHGLEFLAISPEIPLADIIWDIVNSRAPRRDVPINEPSLSVYRRLGVYNRFFQAAQYWFANRNNSEDVDQLAREYCEEVYAEGREITDKWKGFTISRHGDGVGAVMVAAVEKVI